LAKNPKELLKDGWGVPFEIKATKGKNDFIIHSDRLDTFNRSHKLGHPDASNIASDEEDD